MVVMKPVKVNPSLPWILRFGFFPIIVVELFHSFGALTYYIPLNSAKQVMLN